MQPLSFLLLPALALPALAGPVSSAPLTSRAIPGLIGLVFVSEQETCADMIATAQYIDSLDASGLACYEIPEGQRGIHLLVDTPGCQGNTHTHNLAALALASSLDAKLHLSR